MLLILKRESASAGGKHVPLRLFFVDLEKCRGAGANAFAAKALCYEKEVLFYNKFGGLGVTIPACYYATAAPDGKATTLLMAAVSGAAGDTHTSLTAAQVIAAVRELGKLHGASM